MKHAPRMKNPWTFFVILTEQSDILSLWQFFSCIKPLNGLPLSYAFDYYSIIIKDIRMEIWNVYPKLTGTRLWSHVAESWNQSPKVQRTTGSQGSGHWPNEFLFLSSALVFACPSFHPFYHFLSLAISLFFTPPLSSCSSLSLSHFTEPTRQDLFSSVCLLLSIC